MSADQATDALIVNAICELQRHGNTHTEACDLVKGWLAEHDAQVAAKALREWAAAHLANYPEDVFVPPTRDDWDWVARLISQYGSVLDVFSAEIMRRAAHIAIKDADAMTRQADAPAAAEYREHDDSCGYCGRIHSDLTACGKAADDEGRAEA